MGAPLIIDTNQRFRAARPTHYGMSPWVAERIQQLGLDPRDYAARIRGAEERAGVYASVGPRPMPRVTPANTVPCALDYNDVTQQVILDQAAAEVPSVGFYAEDLAPSTFVDVDKGRFPVDDYAESIEIVDDAIGTHGNVQRIQRNHTFVDFATRPRALEVRVNRAVASLAPQLVSVANETRALSARMTLNHEVRVGALVGTATSFHATCRRVLGAGQNWNGGASANPIADMQAMIAAMIAFPNVSMFSLEAWQAVQANDVMRAILASQLGNEGMLQPMDWSLYWGIRRTLVAENRYKVPGSATLQRVYPTTAFAILHVNPTPSARTFAKNFVRRGGVNGWTTTRWFDPDTGGKGADCVKTSYDNEIVPIDDKFGAICTGMRA